MAKKRTAKQRAAHARHHATYRKRLRAEAEAAKPAEEMSQRLKALYAVAPRIGPDGKPLANHSSGDGATTCTQATTSRPSGAATPPAKTSPPPYQAPETAKAGERHSNHLPDQHVVAAATAAPDAPFADLRAPSTVPAIAQQDMEVSTGSSASTVPWPDPEAAQNDLGGFDASFVCLHEDTNATLLDVETDWRSGSSIETSPPKPTIQGPTQETAAGCVRARQESPLPPSAPEHKSSTPLTTTEDMLAVAMPHYEAGMQGLNRFLRLVGDGRKKKQ